MGESKRRRQLDPAYGQAQSSPIYSKFKLALKDTVARTLQRSPRFEQMIKNDLPQLQAQFGEGFFWIDVGFYYPSVHRILRSRQEPLYAHYLNRESLKEMIPPDIDFETFWLQLEAKISRCSGEVTVIFMASLDRELVVNPRFLMLFEVVSFMSK